MCAGLIAFIASIPSRTQRRKQSRCAEGGGGGLPGGNGVGCRDMSVTCIGSRVPSFGHAAGCPPWVGCISCGGSGAGSNELSLQPQVTSSLSGTLEGGSCPLPHMLHLFLLLAPSLHVPGVFQSARSSASIWKAPWPPWVPATLCHTRPRERLSLRRPLRPGVSTTASPIWFRNVCAQEGKGIRAQKAHELGTQHL